MLCLGLVNHKGMAMTRRATLRYLLVGAVLLAVVFGGARAVNRPRTTYRRLSVPPPVRSEDDMQRRGDDPFLPPHLQRSQEKRTGNSQNMCTNVCKKWNLGMMLTCFPSMPHSQIMIARPYNITVGNYITEISQVDTVGQSFSIIGYYWLYWPTCTKLPGQLNQPTELFPLISAMLLIMQIQGSNPTTRYRS